ncbi:MULTISPECIES: ABC transporter permease subunit [Pseudidiomarina]|uniref:Phosphate transport system permease protein n=2 Tax=Pseudidiomarina TaxID=2800384 RepID=A0A368UQT3_9GAMM|nr:MULTISPECIES: ABC transporter permease subunit [Pseudidiomarina]PWW12123.1 phosphate transport system permease protein [Pseudidiomarina maritima]RBP89308.1 phosphate transport system permease protein [Pseudidiomarina tainanensis]RCW31156.1 phosphate transport system permease protein [Pseudidiomarina tainanensis]
MAASPRGQLGASNVRLFKDRAARWGVTFGGGLVLIALLLIFFYLLYVVEPIFRGVDIEQQQSFAIPGQGETVAMGMEEQSEIGYRFDNLGGLSFFALKQKPGTDWQPGQVLLQQQVAEQPTAFAATQPQNKRYVYAVADGKARVIEPKFRTQFNNGRRLTTPVVDFANDGELYQVDPQGRQLQQIAYEYDGDSSLFAAVTSDNVVVVNYLQATKSFLTGAVELKAKVNELPTTGKVDNVVVTPDLRQVFVRQGNRFAVYDVSRTGSVSERQVLNVDKRRYGAITSMQLLAGASSVLFGHDQGLITQWFEVAGENGRQYQYIREFKAGNSAITGLVAEYYRRTFYALNSDGQVGVFHTTSQADLYLAKPEQLHAEQLVIDPRANTLLMQSGNQLHSFKLDNEHPEVSWSGVWQEVWYEGYPEPQYVWQSTSGSDDFEPKFSLVPISFGTIKAAAYAMLFAVPIGLAAAVYTAYFMSPGVRKVVKPTVEIMEALPTVILGFLAGLWLAPLIETYLPGIVATLILIPTSIILMALISSNLPKAWRSKFTDGSAALVLIPVVLLAGWLSFELSPWIESTFFGGNVREYITNELGITFDQRNSLVVGIAMGFAVIPTIFSIAEDAVFSVPKHLSNGSLALGATTWQTLTKVVLLTASPGIFSAVMMGLGRAVGETMIVLMATGNTPIMDWNIFEGMRTLSANIAVEMPESEVGSSHYRILFLAAFVLFIFTFAFNTVAELVRQRLRDKYSSM